MKPDSAYLVSTRNRVVWTPADKRQLDRTAKMLNARGDKLMLRCGSALCPDTTIALAIDDTDPNGRILRCGCTDRHFVPLVKH